jgi:hypothetical protein
MQHSTIAIFPLASGYALCYIFEQVTADSSRNGSVTRLLAQ